MKITGRVHLTLIVVAALTGLASGCRKEATPSVSPPAPGKGSSVRKPTLTIDDVPMYFQKMELIASASGSGVSVQLSTPTADPEKDNSLSFDLMLDGIDDPANLAGSEWRFRTDDAERQETLDGIVLNGRRAVLEPFDMHILFGRQGERATIEIEGQFRWFEPADAQTSKKLVTVSGILTAAYPK